MIHISMLFVLADGTSTAFCNLQTAEDAGIILYQYLGGPNPLAGACIGWMGCSTHSHAFEMSKLPTWSRQDFVDHIALLQNYNLGWTGSRFMTPSEHTVYKAFQDKLWKKRNPWKNK